MARVPWPSGVAGPVLVAILVDLALDLALAPPSDGAELLVRVVTFGIGAAIAVLIGRWLGTRSWPRRGGALTRRVLRRMLRARAAPMILLTDRPDRLPRRGRRALEVIGFTAGTATILTSLLAAFGLAPLLVSGLGGFFVLAALWGAFVLVPYWSATRMGLRVVDPVWWTIEPLSRRYADRLRLSNGAVVLVALGVFVNLAVRAGASQDQALVQGVSTVLTVVASSLVIAVTAVAYYGAREHAIVRELEAEAIAAGVHDARGLSDGDFLPRVAKR